MNGTVYLTYSWLQLQIDAKYYKISVTYWYKQFFIWCDNTKPVYAFNNFCYVIFMEAVFLKYEVQLEISESCPIFVCILQKDTSKLYSTRLSILSKETHLECFVTRQQWNIGKVTSFAMATNKNFKASPKISKCWSCHTVNPSDKIADPSCETLK